MNKIREVPLRRVQITDTFWSERQRIIARTAVPYMEKILRDEVSGAEKSHAIENFRIAAGESKGEYYGMVFQDTDVYKWLETASYSLLANPDPDLEAYTTAWLENILKICYRNANPEISAERLPRVRVYDLRHRFASATLCRWLDEGKNLYNMLPYLRTYMGHSNLSQTAYYIHILPENLLKSCSIDWSKLDNIIPEDDIWDE